MRLSRAVDLVLGLAFVTVLALTLTGTLTLAVVEGRSMEPLLWTGDVVIVYKSGEIRVGDVVIYVNRGNYVIHRVVEIRSNCYIIKGDNNPLPDGCIPKELVIGKVLSIGSSVIKIPGIGYLTLLIRAWTK
ncbi:MAG: signal peptidase I [Thermoprotei archaeon]